MDMDKILDALADARPYVEAHMEGFDSPAGRDLKRVDSAIEEAVRVNDTLPVLIVALRKIVKIYKEAPQDMGLAEYMNDVAGAALLLAEGE